ncbi:MAG TPA: Crp/Fnr family transcriptional regulator [Actinomycetota bacterium]|nr:Crp/Fnr family transcriptional regulator [Actinomycetota bacterium]
MDGKETAGGFLARLSEDDERALFARGRRRRFDAGSTIFHEGEVTDRVVLLVGGRAKVSTVTEDGKEVMLGVRDPGDLLGEFSALDGQPTSANVVAMEPVDALVVDVASFRSWLADHPATALVLLEMVLARLRDADRKRVEFSAHDTVGRVARRLFELAERFGVERSGGVEIALPLTQDELAAWTGASRVGVSQALKALRDRGWVETRRRSITVLDMEALKRRAT